MVSDDLTVSNPMLESNQISERSALLGGIAMAMIFYAILAVFFIKAGVPDVLNGRLWDGDSYMWLVRVQDLWAGGNWWDHTNARISPPEGFTQHWTRPLDFLLLTGTWIVEPFLGFEKGLFWVGVFANSIILVPALFAFAWAARPLIQERWDYQWLWLVGVFFLFMPSGMTNFAVGRPDHHALVILFCTLFLGSALRILQNAKDWKAAIATGLFAGIALWVSIQALPFILAVIFALGLSWLLALKDNAAELAVMGMSATATMTLALLMEYGGIDTGDIYDTLSLPYLSAFALCCLFWLLIFFLQRTPLKLRSFPARALVAGVLAVVVLSTLWYFFPGLFSDPMNSGQGLLAEKVTPLIQELKPVYAGLAAEESFFQLIGIIIRKGALAFIGVPVILYYCVKAPATHRPLWIVLLALVLVYVPLAFFQIRWNGQANSILVFPYAIVAIHLLRKLSEQKKTQKFLAVLRPLAIVFFSVWSYSPLIVANMLLSNEANAKSDQQENADDDKSCDYHMAFPALQDPDALGESQKNIAMGINDAPRVLYRTKHRVYAIANHRMSEGFQHLYDIYSATDDEMALAALRKANTDLILTCKFAPDAAVYKTTEDTPNFHERLADGAVPEFLEPIPLPEGAGNLLFFQVRPVSEIN